MTTADQPTSYLRGAAAPGTIALAVALCLGACKGEQSAEDAALQQAANRAAPAEGRPANAAGRVDPPPAPTPTPPAAGGPDNEGPPPADPGDGSVSPADIDRFVGALAQIREVRQTFAKKIAAAESPEKANELQIEATRKIEERLAKSGMKVAEYERIAEHVTNDPQLQAKVEARLQSLD